MICNFNTAHFSFLSTRRAYRIVLFINRSKPLHNMHLNRQRRSHSATAIRIFHIVASATEFCTFLSHPVWFYRASPLLDVEGRTTALFIFCVRFEWSPEVTYTEYIIWANWQVPIYFIISTCLRYNYRVIWFWF